MKRPGGRVPCTFVVIALWGCAADELVSTSSVEPVTEQVALQRADRERLAASGRYLHTSRALPAARAIEDWARAIDLPLDVVAGAALSGPPEAAAVRSELGVIHPVRGDSFVLLSTGLAGSTAPEPGIDFEPPGSAGDAVTLLLDLRAPPGANRLSLQYDFLSAESPEFVGSIFNDLFIVEITDASGTRTFTTASVNSSAFFAVSTSRARDTGFEIYTDEPDGVDLAFGTGLPDAGLTDFQSFSAAVEAGGALQLRLTVQDTADGILDSAVLIDAIQFSAIEAVDPNPDLVAADGQLISSAEVLAQGGRPVRGAAADGATEVLLRVEVPGPGTVDFALADAGDGGLRALGDEATATIASVRTVSAAGADHAFALYRAPPDFNRGMDGALASRSVRIAASYAADGDGDFASALDLQLVRPPVVLVHGLWSAVLDWSRLPISGDPRFAITYAPYTYACSTSLRVAPQPDRPILGCPWQIAAVDEPGISLCETDRRRSVGAAVREGLANVRRLHIAATQADVVAHGAGGIHVRKYIGSPEYVNLGNLGQGDINRLITLNTPHLGSDVADAISTARDRTPPSALDDFLCRARLQARAPIEPGDVDELTTAQAALVETPVPAHAIVGSGGNLLARRVAMAKLLSKARLYTDVELKQPVRPFRIVGIPSDAFGARDHDLFSDIASQRGGLLDASVSDIAMTELVPDTDHADDYSDADYFHVLRHAAVSDRLVELLNTGVDSPVFGRFAATPGLQPPSTGGAHPSGLGDAQPASGLVQEIRIVSPASGAEVLAGGTVPVEVAVDGIDARAVLAVTDGSVVLGDAPPFTMEIMIPSDSLGPIRLLAIAFDENDDAFVSDDVVLIARSAAPIEAVEIATRDPILFGPGTRRALAVLGRYGDGVARDITASALGTAYGTSNAAVVAVGADGVITAAGAGIATVTAESGGKQDSITVTVIANAAPVAHAGPDLSHVCVAPGAAVPVQLDGTASFDPEGAPLAWSWLEDGDLLATGRAPTVELGGGVHSIDLVVSDGFGSAPGTGHDTVVVSITEDTAPPDVSVSSLAPLFPPDLRYRELSLADCARAVDVCDGEENVDAMGQIVAIHSDEVDARHPFDPRNDIVILGNSRFKVRRQAELLGNGRVYEVEFTVQDAQHNSSSVHGCFIGVRALGDHDPPVNDGRVFTVRP